MIGMNWSGGIAPRVGWFQRSSIMFEQAMVFGANVHFGRKGGEAAAAVFLGLVEREVGGAHQGFLGLAIDPAARNPDRRANVQPRHPDGKGA